MKILFIILFSVIHIFPQNVKDTELDSILKRFSEVQRNIYKLEYNVQRIDTFSTGKTRSIKGYALIRREKQDNAFGYYFFGKCFNYPNYQNIYDGINSFVIDSTKKTYQLVKSVKGAPGEQMVMRIAEMVFSPDNKFSKVILSSDTCKNYIIEYQFKDDPPYTNFRKIIALNKQTFLPVEFTMSGFYLASRYSFTFILSDLKINDDVTTSIQKIERGLASYTMLPSKEKKEEKNLTNKASPDFTLPQLLDTHNLSDIHNSKITLLDFWEVWCGYCVESMPKVESLFQKYSNKIDVIGIVTQDTAYAKKLIEKLKITFASLIGNKYVLDKYGVDSFPRYFLINKNGIIKKEYFGFSKQIEKDIRKLLKE